MVQGDALRHVEGAHQQGASNKGEPPAAAPSTITRTRLDTCGVLACVRAVVAVSSKFGCFALPLFPLQVQPLYPGGGAMQAWPLAHCNSSCSLRGQCVKAAGAAKPKCLCWQGWTGAACEQVSTVVSGVLVDIGHLSQPASATALLMPNASLILLLL